MKIKRITGYHRGRTRGRDPRHWMCVMMEGKGQMTVSQRTGHLTGRLAKKGDIEEREIGWLELMWSL